MGWAKVVAMGSGLTWQEEPRLLRGASFGLEGEAGVKGSHEARECIATAEKGEPGDECHHANSTGEDRILDEVLAALGTGQRSDRTGP